MTEGAWLAAAGAFDPGRDHIIAGSVAVKVRFVFIKNENRFGTAMARALTARSAAAGTTLTGVIDPTWTTQRSDVVNAGLKVRRAEAALAAAQADGDAAVIRAAEDSLVEARLELNVAASAAGQTVPYPGLTALPRT